jgi:hypothetical protein
VEEGDFCYGWPLALEPLEFKEWINGVAEFQIQYKNITVSKTQEQAKTNVNCYNWGITQRYLHTALP